MSDSSFAELENAKPVPMGGLNERVVPEGLPALDLSKLIGLRQNKLGELVRYTGETRIENLPPLSSIRGIFVLGEYLIIQTDSTLLRARNNEIFPEFTQITPELFPDNYAPPGPPPPAINPELMSYALVNYELTGGNNGGSTIAGVWNVVPINVEESDSDNRVSIAGSVITITAGSYPAFVRIDGEVCIDGPASISGANSNQRAILRLRNNVTNAIVATGTHMRDTTANASLQAAPTAYAKIKGRFSIAAATDFKLEAYTVLSSSFGKALNVGVGEKYAQLEILIEE